MTREEFREQIEDEATDSPAPLCVVPVKGYRHPGTPSAREFDGNLDNFFDAVRAMEAEVILLSGYTIGNDHLAKYAEDIRLLQDVAASYALPAEHVDDFAMDVVGIKSIIGQVDAIVKAHMGQEAQLCVEVQSGRWHLAHYISEDWYEALQKCIVDAARLREKWEQIFQDLVARLQREKEAALRQRIDALADDVNFVGCSNVQRTAVAYAVEHIPELAQMEQARVKELIVALLDKMKIKK